MQTLNTNHGTDKLKTFRRCAWLGRWQLERVSD